jgi:ABC-type bacteriocin/lantibiotic exporter with double-glycine peptidase domain
MMRARSDFVWLLTRLTSLRWRIALGLLCVSLAGVAITIDPLLMRRLIDDALPRHRMPEVFILVAGIGLCYYSRNALYGLGSLVNFSIAQRCVRDLRFALLEQMNRLSVDYHEQTPTGEKLTRLEHDVDEISNLGADTANQSIRAVLFFVLNLTMMAKLSLQMTLVVLPLIPLFAIVQRKFSRLLKAKAEDARQEVGSATAILNEHLSAVPQIQFLGAETLSAGRAASVWDGMLRAQWIQRRTQISFSLSISAVLVAAVIVAFAFGSMKVLGGSLTIGGLVAYTTYVTRVFEPVSSAMDLYARIQSVGASIRRVREVLSLEPSVQDKGHRELDHQHLKQGIEIQGVSFAYNQDLVLKELQLRIAPGERIALIGSSGSGKSTLARLLVRAADPGAGTILIDGRPLSDYTLASLRRTICYVPQHPILFQGSVRENLLYANPKATDIEIGRALDAAQFSETLRRLPQGLETQLGPEAVSLSGGERQRLAIARALLRDSAVLIFDESTSALDAPTEHAVFSKLATFGDRQTLILISHRLSALAWVDRFAVLDRGRVTETGTHRQLYAQSTIYRSLYDASLQETTSSG